MVRGRGNRAFGISHSDLEVGTRLLKKIVGKILTAKGIRALVDGIYEVSCDTAVMPNPAQIPLLMEWMEAKTLSIRSLFKVRTLPPRVTVSVMIFGYWPPFI